MLEMNLEKESEPEELGRGSSPSRLFRMGDAQQQQGNRYTIAFFALPDLAPAMACGIRSRRTGAWRRLINKGQVQLDRNASPRALIHFFSHPYS